MKRFVVLEGFWEKLTEKEREFLERRAHEARMTVGEYVGKMLSDYLAKRRGEES